MNDKKKLIVSLIEHSTVWGLTLLFTILKLNGVIDWNWGLVFIAPIAETAMLSSIFYLSISLMYIIKISK